MSDQIEKHQRTSRAARRVRRFLDRSWQGLVVVAVVMSLGVLAVLSPGLVRADVRLDEGTVQIAKRSTGGLGTLNAQIDELASHTIVGDSQFRILQDGQLVLVHGTESSTLSSYEPGRNLVKSPVQLPPSAIVELGGATLLVVNPVNGKVWFGNPEAILASDFQEEKAHLEVGEFGSATVTSGGEVIGLDVQRSVLVRPGPDGPVESPLPFSLNEEGAKIQLSAVGDNAVVLDGNSGRIWVEGMSQPFEVSGASDARLVEPAPDALGGEDKAKAIYATHAGLIALTSDGPRSLTGNIGATPVQPIQLGDCVYGAFGNQFVRACRGRSPEIRNISNVPEDANLVFQVNRSTVVLNDVNSGVAWMVNKNMERIDDWERVIPEDDDTDGEATDIETDLPDRDEPNQAPIAKDDDLSARAGRSTILDVLDNDTDPDGDVLTISPNGEPSGASLETVRGGAGLQITVDSDATGTLTFDYTIDDGRDGKDRATVTVNVLPAGQEEANEEPHKHGLAQPLEIALGDTITKRVLMDWRDPDGDSLILVDASLPPGAEDEVSFTPDGEVTFRDIGKTMGAKTVLVTVSDGHLEAVGEMVVTVTEEAAKPIAYGDFVTTAVGKDVLVYPLANDVGTNLALTEVDAGECCKVVTNFREKWFSFNATEPGTYYVTYKASNVHVAPGLVRIDVLPESTDTEPVAALDVALLPPGGSVTIDPVLNDTDRDGDVLVVQSVSQVPGLQVVLKRRHLVTIEAEHPLDNPVTLTYRLSDGKHSVPGTIVVLPTSATGSDKPQAEPDQVKIRAGTTQTVDVLDNDISPVGLDLELDSLVDNPLGDRAWIDADRLRVEVPAGMQASSIAITYQIKDSSGLIASSRLNIAVVSEDAENGAPTPLPIVERVLAGTKTKLVIPMEGIDPDGDAVRLVGLGSGPSLGRVMAVGDGWLSYEAFPDSEGTDVFSYQVVDSLGELGFGEIRVGVAPAVPDNSPPTGITDLIEVRPGRHVQISALRNDLDIDGDSISYSDTEPVEMDGIEEVKIIEDRDIAFVAPPEPGQYTGIYWIKDSRLAIGSGDLQITVDEDAELLPPEARDDIVPVSAVVDEDWVDVDVTANDLDPDGRQEDLRVDVPDHGAPEGETAKPTEDGRGVSVKVTEEMQQLRYEVEDSDGLRATGMILVPGRNDSVPVLKEPELELEITAGQALGIDINEHVDGTAGRGVQLSNADSVSVTHGNVKPGNQRIEYTPDADYEGPASVVFEAEDDVAPGDKTGRSAYISIPIKVTAPPNSPKDGNDPTLTANTAPKLIGGQEPVLKVGPGEGDARLDLKPLFHDEQGDGYFIRDVKSASGDTSINWEQSGTGNQLFANAPINAAPGTVRILSGKVVDVKEASESFIIRLEVVSSTRPTPTVVDDVAETNAGQEVSVSVLANDKSNLLDRPKLMVDAAQIISGPGRISHDEESVKITPAEGFVGTLTASYTVMDATLDRERRKSGTVRVTVKAPPSRPGAPRDGQTGNGTVTFTYTPGSPNGYEVTSRTAVALTASGTEVKTTQCQSTTCTVKGLPNGAPYRFRVVETNQAGQSEPSPESAEYTPDVKPQAPAKPVVGAGDKQLTVKWQKPVWKDLSNPGSAVERYTLTLLDQAGNQVSVKELPASSTSHTWTGLQNGTRYRFKVSAGNRAGASPDSVMSDVEWPAGPPSAPRTVNATATENELGGGFEVSFSASGLNNNGDAIQEFLVTPVSESGDVAGKAVTVPFSGQATLSRRIDDLGQKRYKFKVQAKNKAGLGPASTSAQWQVAWKLPTLTNLASDVGDRSITLRSNDNFGGVPAANPVKEYKWRDAGGWKPLPHDGRITGLTNGRKYNILLRVRVDGRASQPAAFNGLMPKSPQPIWPDFKEADFHFKGTSRGLVVVLDRPTDTVDSGGWDPNGYEFLCRSHCETSGAWTGANSFLVPGNPASGTEVSVQVRHRDFAGEQPTRKHRLKAPFTASVQGKEGTFSFELNYVRNATCTLLVTGAKRQTFTQRSGTRLGASGIKFPVNARTDLHCTADRLDETFPISSP